MAPKVTTKVTDSDIDEGGLYVGDVPLVKSLRSSKMVHIRKQSYGGDAIALCNGPADEVVGFLGSNRPTICATCRRLVAQGVKWFE